jgi:hypothetical protein
LIIDDIEDGVGHPNQDFNRLKKQEVYVPYYRVQTQVAPSGQVATTVDRSIAGFVDLAPTDDVRKSVDNGTIAGHQNQGNISVTEVQPGDLVAPTISTAKFDTSDNTEIFEIEVTIQDGTSVAEDFEVTIDNTNITSTTVSATDPNAGTDDSNTIAAALASAVNSDGTLSPEVEASASGDTVTITTLKPSIPFTYSVNATDPDGTITGDDVATGRVVIEGSDFSSVDPILSKAFVTDTPFDQREFTEDEIRTAGGVFTDTTVVVPNSLHAHGTSSGDVDRVNVFANEKADSAGVTDV